MQSSPSIWDFSMELLWHNLDSFMVGVLMIGLLFFALIFQKLLTSRCNFFIKWQKSTGYHQGNWEKKRNSNQTKPWWWNLAKMSKNDWYCSWALPQFDSLSNKQNKCCNWSGSWIFPHWFWRRLFFPTWIGFFGRFLSKKGQKTNSQNFPAWWSILRTFPFKDLCREETQFDLYEKWLCFCTRRSRIRRIWGWNYRSKFSSCASTIDSSIHQ